MLALRIEAGAPAAEQGGCAMTPPQLVICGASGDLAGRLLLPALFHLEQTGRLPELGIVGFAVEKWGADEFRAHVHERIRQFSPGYTDALWQRFEPRLSFVSGDFSSAGTEGLARVITGDAVFYLALPPKIFADAARGLAQAGLARSDAGAWRRLVVEKPFGTDLASARALNASISQHWREDQVLRIDHFLGKETAQNILVFRLANGFVEPLLNSRYVSQVQITAAETLGLEGRVTYYDGAGAIRDMIQNHLMQLFTLAALEPPPVWDADVVREHKVEVLRAVRAIPAQEVARHAVRGQYAKGKIGGADVPGYLEEQGIPAGSNTETFAALKLYVDNWRWKGVPFYLRSGKRLASNATEVAFQFREPPRMLFREVAGATLDPNWLVFRIKPNEAIDLVAFAKQPGLTLETRPVILHTPYLENDEVEYAAYEQLLLDAMNGDRSQFIRYDEVDYAWQLLDPILTAWKSGSPESYAAGADGPPGAHAMLEPGHSWRPLT
jgi:glucose-6-phosphate 1-dehydrogenase